MAALFNRNRKRIKLVDIFGLKWKSNQSQPIGTMLLSTCFAVAFLLTMPTDVQTQWYDIGDFPASVPWRANSHVWRPKEPLPWMANQPLPYRPEGSAVPWRPEEPVDVWQPNSKKWRPMEKPSTDLGDMMQSLFEQLEINNMSDLVKLGSPRPMLPDYVANLTIHVAQLDRLPQTKPKMRPPLRCPVGTKVYLCDHFNCDKPDPSVRHLIKSRQIEVKVCPDRYNTCGFARIEYLRYHNITKTQGRAVALYFECDTKLRCQRFFKQHRYADGCKDVYAEAEKKIEAINYYPPSPFYSLVGARGCCNIKGIFIPPPVIFDEEKAMTTAVPWIIPKPP